MTTETRELPLQLIAQATDLDPSTKPSKLVPDAVEGEQIKPWIWAEAWEIPVGFYHRSESEQGKGPMLRLILDNQNRVYAELFGWLRPERWMVSVTITIGLSDQANTPPLREVVWQGSPGEDNQNWPDNGNGGRQLLNPSAGPDLWNTLKWAHPSVSVVWR